MSKFRYMHRSMLSPRELDFGYAIHLSRMARTHVQEQDGRYIVLSKGQQVFASADLRDVVQHLRERLDSAA